jgi:hypothetical protein
MSTESILQLRSAVRNRLIQNGSWAKIAVSEF